MIDENILISAIKEQQIEDDSTYQMLYFDDSRDKIIETIENMRKKEQKQS